jgi:ArsR family transcriptional regulator, arsenate/arsenite/antimonite-responsive transcriptional repressor
MHQEVLMYASAMSKIESGPPQAAQFHSLSDATRLRILAILRSGEHCVCELMEQLELGQSLLSFHLKTLKEAGLVRDRRQGRWTYYTLNEEGLRAMASALVELATPPRRTGPQRRCRS